MLGKRFILNIDIFAKILEINIRYDKRIWIITKNMVPKGKNIKLRIIAINPKEMTKGIAGEIKRLERKAKIEVDPK